ncbi:MAG: hypothetical protein AB7P42_19895 [Gammaproteobacteria bacterium]
MATQNQARGTRPRRTSSQPRHSWSLLLALTALLGGCGQGSAEGGYFPLQPGYSWQYRVLRTTMDGSRELRHALSVPERAPNAPADLHVRATLDGQRTLYRDTEDGIYRVGIERRRGPRLPEDELQQLVLPRDIEAAREWRGKSTTQLIESSAAPWESLFRVQVPVEMHYHVADRGAQVDTPAGRFTRCLRIDGAGDTRTDVGSGLGETTINVATREWYAPGVGLVRLERDETTSAKALAEGSMVMELDGWNAP